MLSSHKCLPIELWNQITLQLTSLSLRHAAMVLGFNLSPLQEEHSRVWDAIFEDPSWVYQAIIDLKVKPVLIGQNLHNYINGTDKSVYLTLVIRDKDGVLRFRKDSFLKSLRDRPLLNSKNEVYFPSSNITLNVADIVIAPEIISVDTKRLFSYRHQSLKSAYLLWDDPEYKFRTIHSEDIVGIGGKASTLTSVSFICGLSVTFSDHFREQYVFQTSRKSYRDVQLMKNHKKLDEECAGWMWV